MATLIDSKLHSAWLKEWKGKKFSALDKISVHQLNFETNTRIEWLLYNLQKFRLWILSLIYDLKKGLKILALDTWELWTAFSPKLL